MPLYGTVRDKNDGDKTLRPLGLRSTTKCHDLQVQQSLQHSQSELGTHFKLLRTKARISGKNLAKMSELQY